VRVSFAADVFADPAALTDILDLIRAFATGRHDLMADPEIIAAATSYLSVNAPGHVAAFNLLAHKGTVAATWAPVRTHLAAIEVTSATLEAHAADLRESAVLVVEDQDSDGHFVRAVCAALRAERILQALDNGWLEIAHGGGSDGVQRVAKAKVKRFRITARVMALLDSDRMLPGQATRAHKKEQNLAAAGIQVHVLEFREAENYVPDQVLGRIVRHKKSAIRLTVFRRLSPEQRAFFDMKKGFKAGGDVPIAQQSLYVNLGTQVLRGLQTGFGDDLLRHFKEASASLTERDFNELGPSVIPELRDFLAKLASVI
jgi:hypothetical protein